MKCVLSSFVEKVVQDEVCFQGTKTETRTKESPDKLSELLLRMSKTRTDVGRETPDRSFIFPRSI
jgi:hypothetical protein